MLIKFIQLVLFYFMNNVAFMSSVVENVMKIKKHSSGLKRDMNEYGKLLKISCGIWHHFHSLIS